MTRLHNAQMAEIDFSKGMNAWNLEARLGTEIGVAYERSHPMYDRESPDGYLDDIVNFDFTSEGSLIQRGPVFPKLFTNGNAPNSAVDEQIYILTRKAYADPTAGGSTHTPLFGVVNNSTNQWKLYRAVDQSPINTPADITTSVNSRLCAVFYNGRWYIYRNDVQNSFYSLLATGATPYVRTTHAITHGGGVVTGVTKALIWKDRAWLKGVQGISYSKATDPAVFAAPDGGFFQLPTKANIKDFIVYEDNLFIVDKANGVWQFSYSTDPGTDGYLRQVVEPTSLVLATSSNNNDSLAVSNGELFIASNNNVYRYVNGFVSSIADQLHLDLNGRDQLQIWDMGKALFVSSYWWGGSDKNSRNYIYHHSNRAWTRYHFEWGGSYGNAETRKVYVDTCQFHQYGSGSARFQIILNGSSIVNQGTAFHPPYELSIDEGFFGGSVHDGFHSADVWNGNNSTIYREPILRIDTGVKYFGERTRFKRMLQFTMDAYLGWRQAGPALGKAPYRTIVRFAPQALPVKSDSSLQRLPDTAKQEYSYQVAINQRARGVGLLFETEDDQSYGPTYQDTFDVNEEVSTKAYINRIICHIRYPRDGARRNNKSSTAYTEANTT